MSNDSIQKEKYHVENEICTIDNEHNIEEIKKQTKDNITGIIYRRNRILSYLKKEQVQIAHPDLRPFLNDRHAIECMVPYHIFNKTTPEDFLFLETEKTKSCFNLEKLKEKVNEIIEVANYKQKNEFNIVLYLLDLQAYKYVYEKHLVVYEELCKSKECKLQTKAKKIERNTVIKVKLGKENYKTQHRFVRAVNCKLFFSRDKDNK